MGDTDKVRKFHLTDSVRVNLFKMRNIRQKRSYNIDDHNSQNVFPQFIFTICIPIISWMILTLWCSYYYSPSPTVFPQIPTQKYNYVPPVRRPLFTPYIIVYSLARLPHLGHATDLSRLSTMRTLCRCSDTLNALYGSLIINNVFYR